MENILITGATGTFGRAAIEHLLRKDIPVENISALVREKTKAEELQKGNIDRRTGDYDDYDSLLKAFEGIDKLYRELILTGG